MDTIEMMYQRVAETAAAMQFSETKKALVMMARYHDGQFRKGPEKQPYIVHPLTMACHALSLQLLDDALIATCLLHDVVEDCNVAPEELDVAEDIRAAVAALTFEKLPGETKHEAKQRYFLALRENALAAMVKLLDRCHNISQMANGFTDQRMLAYLEETEEMVLPLMQYVKSHSPAYASAIFAVEYQLQSVMDAIRHFSRAV